MIPFPKYNDSTVIRPARRYPFGVSSMQLSLLMPKRTESQQGSEPQTREPFITLDDCIQSAEELFGLLNRLGTQKNPLDVRRGVRTPVNNNEPSKTLKAPSRTYFFDLRTGLDGRRFLVITESRIKDKQRSQITVFPEEAPEFVGAVKEMTDLLR
jgi:hypothetical protein